MRIRALGPAAAPVLWGLLAALAGTITAPLEPNLLEEGIVLHVAERMAQGDHLYRDVAIHTGPLPYELLALLFRLLGAHLELARGVVVVLQALATAAAFATARRAGAGPLAHAAAAPVAVAPLLLFPLFSTYFYTTLGFHLGLLSVYAGVRGLDSPRWAVAAGALVASVALCKQNLGVEFAAAFLPAFALGAAPGRRLRGTAQVALGGVAAAAATLGLYGLRGDLRALLYAQIELPFAVASAEAFQSTYMNLWPLGAFSPAVEASRVLYLPSLALLEFDLFADVSPWLVLLTQFLFALPLLGLLGLLLRGVLPGRPHGAFWLHGAFLLAMTLNLFPRSDWGHLVVALPPAATQLVLLVAERGLPRSVALALSAVGVASLALPAAAAGRYVHEIKGPPIYGPRVPLRPVSISLRLPGVARVIHYLLRHARPGEVIFVARQEPLLYFATRTVNPTPFPGIFPGMREWQEPIILEALDDVRYVVMSDLDQQFFTYYAEQLPAVNAYLERHYEIAPGFPLDDLNWISVLARVPDRGATSFDFIEALDGARLFTRDFAGVETPASVAQARFSARQNKRVLPLPMGTGGGGADFRVRIPKGASFQAGLGFRGLVSDSGMYGHPSGTTARLLVRRNGAFEPLHELRIDDRPDAGRSWTPVEVDLSELAGETVELRLEIRASHPLYPEGFAWWGSPRIAVRPGAG